MTGHDEQAKGFFAKQMNKPEVMTIPRHIIKQMKRDYPKWLDQMLGVPGMSDDKTKE